MKKVCDFVRVRKQNIRERKSDSSDDEEETKAVHGTKRKMNSVLQSSSKPNKEENVPVLRYSADTTGKKARSGDFGATAEFEADTEFDKDHQAIFERIAKQKNADDSDDGLYKGLKSYRTSETKESADGKVSSFSRRGPIRAPTNIRSTTRWDYQPDICKDYKETGFCGFGDSCKFLHDRSDYKFGWQLEQEELKCRDSDESDEHKYEIHSSDDDDMVPHICTYCHGPFVDPVVTRCQHYFCCKCALDMAKTGKGRCSACDTDTEGTFKNADYILDKLQAIEDRRAKKIEKSDSD